jgi:putative FmdB family regulatory protein
MPNYDYYCPECKDKKVISHSMFDSHEQLCEYCKVPLKKGFTAPLVTFKGGGWGASNN